MLSKMARVCRVIFVRENRKVRDIWGDLLVWAVFVSLGYFS